MKLIFLHGWPGVGKLTVARELSRLTGYKLFHNHLTVDLVGSVFEFGSPAFVELREHIWLSVFTRAAESNISGLIFTFVFEKTVRESFLETAVKAVASRGGEVIFIELVCERKELERRMTDPSREKYGKLMSVDLFNELIMAGRIYSPALKERNFQVDTTALDPASTAQEIMRLCGLQSIS